MRITYVDGATPVPFSIYGPIDVHIGGRPRTKGSLRHKGHGHMVEQVAGSAAWRQLVAERLAGMLGQEQGPDGPVRRYLPYDGPVFVHAVFMFIRSGADPDSHPVSIGYGDLDKLARNIGDAVTDAGVIADDRLIVEWYLSKTWAAPWPGVKLRIGPADGPVEGLATACHGMPRHATMDI